VLGLNILFRNSLDTFHRRPVFRIISTNCDETPETKAIKYNTVANELQSHDPTNRVTFCNWILPHVLGGENSPHLRTEYLQIKPSHNSRT